MDLPKNKFKAAIAEGRQQIGLWSSLGGDTAPEILAGSGFDWVLIDTEHSHMDVPRVLNALQAMAPYELTNVAVRPADNDPVLIKRILDFGALTLVIPYVQTPEEATQAVRASRYGPDGFRGVAGHIRAAAYSRIPNYTARANAEICIIVQVETIDAMGKLEEIALVDGVDGVFIGPADLAASMGFPGQTDHPAVKAQIEGAIKTLKRLGVPAGILTLDTTYAAQCIDHGTIFTAVGTDTGLLMDGAAALRAKF